jgi:transcriptional regulator with XRE-family HTH domain
MIGENLKRLRSERSLSQTDLGKAVFGDELKTDNAAQVKIARMEANKQEPTSTELAKIAAHFSVPMCSLLDEPLSCIFKGSAADDSFIDIMKQALVIYHCQDQGIKDMFINSLKQISMMAESSTKDISKDERLKQMEKQLERMHQEIQDLRIRLEGQQTAV